MIEAEKNRFDLAVFLAQAGLGRRVVQIRAKENFFSQGDAANCVFYLQSGRAALTVLSSGGKEATLTILSAGDFVGEESMAGPSGLRMATATATTDCVALRIDRSEMIRVMHEEHEFSDLFLKFLLDRCIRTQADLVDQLFNSSEKRLARILLLMAEFGKPDDLPSRQDLARPATEQKSLIEESMLTGGTGDPGTPIPKISQETLAEMVGTTRSRVNFFMNRFRKLGFIEYNGGILVYKSLLKVILYD
jgi:CRP/FNR family cyclic AMP-dependent transcriptional regulator